MYERMLNKQDVPSFDDLIGYSGENGGTWIELDKYIMDTFEAQGVIRFPYGNKYGWGKKYSQKRKHICDVFAENGAFTVFFRISNNAIDNIYDELSDYAKEICNHKYPCGEGGWLHFRVLKYEHLKDLYKMLSAKMNKRT